MRLALLIAVVWTLLCSIVACAEDVPDKHAKVKAFVDQLLATRSKNIAGIKSRLRDAVADKEKVAAGKIDRQQKELVRITKSGEYRFKSPDAKADRLGAFESEVTSLRGELLGAVESDIDLATAPQLAIPFQPGAVGCLQERGGTVLQVIDKSSVLLTTHAIDQQGKRFNDTVVIVRGVPTAGITDDTFRTYADAFIVAGTESYKSVVGGKRTVFVLESINLKNVATRPK